jgi:hypothetical protein
VSELALSRDADFLNEIVNAPGMEGARLGQKSLDLAEHVKNTANVFLANEYGGFLFVKDGDWYEVHTNFLPEGRGERALNAAREAAWHMFTQTPCLGIRTSVVKGNFAARALTKRMGFANWGVFDLDGREATLYVLTIKEWARTLGSDALCQQSSSI